MSEHTYIRSLETQVAELQVKLATAERKQHMSDLNFNALEKTVNSAEARVAELEKYNIVLRNKLAAQIF